MKKKYDIKTTDVETLKKWYHLMTLGRALDEKAPVSYTHLDVYKRQAYHYDDEHGTSPR